MDRKLQGLQYCNFLQYQHIFAVAGWNHQYASYRKKGKDNIKIEDNLNSFENLKNIDNLKNENELKKEYDLTNEDEDDLIYGDDLRNIALMWQMATNKYWKGK